MTYKEIDIFLKDNSNFIQQYNLFYKVKNKRKGIKITLLSNDNLIISNGGIYLTKDNILHLFDENLKQFFFSIKCDLIQSILITNIKIKKEKN